MQNIYIAIDLKSFYASVECMERELNPLTTNLVVADSSRTEKTICLAVSPSLKSWGISGRPRLFEVVAKVKEINSKRRDKAYNRTFEGSTYNNNEILDNNNLTNILNKMLIIDNTINLMQNYLNKNLSIDRFIIEMWRCNI